MNIRYPIYEGVYRILTVEQRVRQRCKPAKGLHLHGKPGQREELLCCKPVY